MRSVGADDPGSPQKKHPLISLLRRQLLHPEGGEALKFANPKALPVEGAKSFAPAVRGGAKRKRGSNREQKEAWYAREARDLPM